MFITGTHSFLVVGWPLGYSQVAGRKQAASCEVEFKKEKIASRESE